MGGWTDAVIRGVDRAGAEAADHVLLREHASAQLRRFVGFDLAVWATIDPLTAMWTSCVVDGADRDVQLEAEVFANEYGDTDVLKLADLSAAHPTQRVGILSVATEGELETSPRFREVFAPRGFTDELRLIFHDGSAAWGALVLLRSGGEFDTTEAEACAALSKPFGQRLRTALLRGAVAGNHDGYTPGLILCGPGGQISEMSNEARALLDAAAALDAPAAVSAVAAKYRSGSAATAALPTRSGRWLGLHATELGGRVAVVVEEIRPFQLAEIIVRSLGLTDREREVVALLARGSANRQIATAMGLSEWTVQDHVKRILAKFGVNSRTELVASMFFTHYEPLHARAAEPSPRGYFLGHE
jgi:DNA-binding CsgD family transcriptional regulator